MTIHRKLSAQDIRDIVALSEEYSYAYVGKQFSIHWKTVSTIVKNPEHYITSNNLSTSVFQLSSLNMFVSAGNTRIVE